MKQKRMISMLMALAMVFTLLSAPQTQTRPMNPM